MQKFNRQYTAYLCKLALFLVAIACFAQMSLAAPKSATKAKTPNSKYAAIVIDANNGKTLYQENANAKRFPASLTKMMTLYMLFEAMQAGRIAPETPIPVSAYAAARPPTKLGIKPGHTITAEVAAKALITRSANDVASAVAEYLGGSESRFAKNMTATARKLGMMNTNFANASGLPDNNNYSTARDMAILSLALREHFPQYYHLFNITSFSYKGQTINSHNRLVRNMKGVDGIKTGFINASGFNVATSMREGDKSLVAVVMGGRSSASRDEHMRSLLNRYIGKASKAKKTTLLVAKVSSSPDRQAMGEHVAQFTLPEGHRAPVPMAKASLVADASVNNDLVKIDQLIEEDTSPLPPTTLAFIALTPKPVLPAVETIEQVLHPAIASKPVEQNNKIIARTAADENHTPIISDKISAREHDALLIAALTNEYPGSQPSILTVNAQIEDQYLIPLPSEQIARGESDDQDESQEIDIFTTASISNGKKGWVIQIATTPTVREADIALYKALNTAGERLTNAEPYLQLNDKGDERYYRARFAGFKSQKSALNACAELQSKAINCYVFED